MTDELVIRVAYADDHKVVRKGIISFINKLGGILVDIEADNGRDLIKQIGEAVEIPDICMLDINMPEMNGFDTIVELRKKWPDIKVLVLTAFDIEIYIIRMIMYGANGYLLKSCDPDEIKNAIFSIYNNGMYYSDVITRHFFNAVRDKEIKLPNLTGREIQVLNLCCGDLSYGQIAEKIGTTTRSVEGYRDSLFKKLNTNSRVSLAMFAVQFGLVPVEIYTSGDKNFLQKKPKNLTE
jgi:two-component system, NarL family, invasion response regulator UvrY